MMSYRAMWSVLFFVSTLLLSSQLVACGSDDDSAQDTADVQSDGSSSGGDDGSANSDSSSGGDDGSSSGGACPLSDFPAAQYRLSDANQDKCYDPKGDEMTCPAEGALFHGQDAQYVTVTPSYSLACDGTVVLDDNTRLMWERAHHDARVSYATADSYCEALSLGGYDDWRMPSLKELMSISDWRGSQHVTGAFYIDDDYFDFDYPDIDSSGLTGTHQNQMMGQTWSSTSRPDSENLQGDTKYFYNFLDAHIKSNSATRADAELFYRCVRGDESAIDNSFRDNGDQTVTDDATGLMWQKANGEESAGDYQFDWPSALTYCEGLALAGHEDWRLPDVKELQSIVDYDPEDWAGTRMVLDLSVFEFNLPAGKDLNTPPMTSPPDGSSVAPFFWSSTSHGDASNFAAYVCFGPCWAVEDQNFNFDFHGPGAQRSDPKDDQRGELWNMIGESIGDQKDVVQVNNFVRCVR